MFAHLHLSGLALGTDPSDHTGDIIMAAQNASYASAAGQAEMQCTAAPTQDITSCPDGYTMYPAPAADGGGNMCRDANGNDPYTNCLTAANAIPASILGDPCLAIGNYKVVVGQTVAGAIEYLGGDPTGAVPAWMAKGCLVLVNGLLAVGPGPGSAPAPVMEPPIVAAPIKVAVAAPALQPTAQPVATPAATKPAVVQVPANASATVQNIVAQNTPAPATAPATCTISLLPSTGLCDYYVYAGGAVALLALWYFTKGK